MKINYSLNGNNIIESWCKVPFDENLPWIEVPDGVQIHEGFDSVINRVLIQDVQGYIEFNNKQNERNQKYSRIAELKALLDKTDYLTLKFTDGALSEEEYAPIRKQRQSYRDEINQLEKQL